MTKRKKSFWLRVGPFMPLFLLAVGLLSAALSPHEGWRRFAVLIGMGVGALTIVPWFLFGQNWRNDRRFLPKLKDEFLPMLEKITIFAETDKHAHASFYDGDGIGTIAFVRGPDGERYMLDVTPRKGRISVHCAIDRPDGTRTDLRYPSGFFETVRLEPWFREPMERLCLILKRKNAESALRLERMGAFLDKLDRQNLTPPDELN